MAKKISKGQLLTAIAAAVAKAATKIKAGGADLATGVEYPVDVILRVKGAVLVNEGSTGEAIDVSAEDLLIASLLADNERSVEENIVRLVHSVVRDRKSKTWLDKCERAKALYKTTLDQHARAVGLVRETSRAGATKCEPEVWLDGALVEDPRTAKAKKAAKARPAKPAKAATKQARAGKAAAAK